MSAIVFAHYFLLTGSRARLSPCKTCCQLSIFPCYINYKLIKNDRNVFNFKRCCVVIIIIKSLSYCFCWFVHAVFEYLNIRHQSSISPVLLHFVHKFHRFVVATTCMMYNYGHRNVLGCWWCGGGRRCRGGRESKLALALVVQTLVQVVHVDPCYA